MKVTYYASDLLRDKLVKLLTEEKLAYHTKLMSDGFFSSFGRTNEEAAAIAADAIIEKLVPMTSTRYVNYDDGHAGSYPHQPRLAILDLGPIK